MRKPASYKHVQRGGLLNETTAFRVPKALLQLGMVGLVFSLGCRPKALKFYLETSGKLDAVVIPGCPSEADGSLSECQWQRVVWGAQLWEDGVTERFITSGNAVYTPHIEAEALKAGLIALGVPEDRIHLETQALHSDQNASYSLAIADTLDLQTLGVASHPGHGKMIGVYMAAWADRPVYDLSIPLTEAAGLREDVPSVSTAPVPPEEWLPLEAREEVLAERLDKGKRPSSFLVYTWQAMSGIFARTKRPLPPVVEPTLCNRRHRVDTESWPTTC